MRTFILFVVLYVICMPAGIAKPQDTACVVDKYGQYAAAQEEWQRDLTKLVLSAYPQFAEVARLYLGDQLTKIELRRIAAEFIAWHAPEKLNLAAPLNQWVTLSTLNEEEIAKTSRRYSDLLQSTKQARKRPPHPDGDELRKVMREKVVNMPECKTLAEKFTASVAQIENIVCE